MTKDEEIQGLRDLVIAQSASMIELLSENRALKDALVQALNARGEPAQGIPEGKAAH